LRSSKRAKIPPFLPIHKPADASVIFHVYVSSSFAPSPGRCFHTLPFTKFKFAPAGASIIFHFSFFIFHFLRLSPLARRADTRPTTQSGGFAQCLSAPRNP